MVWAVLAIAITIVVVYATYKFAYLKGFDEGYRRASWDSVDLC